MAGLNLAKFKKDMDFKERIQRINEKKKDLLFTNPTPINYAHDPFEDYGVIIIQKNMTSNCLVKVVDSKTGETLDEKEWPKVESGYCWAKIMIAEMVEKRGE